MKISLKTRLTIIVSFIVIITLLGQGVLLIHNWKQAIRSEVDSSYNLAKRLVGSSFITPKSSLSDVEKKEIVGVLEGMRHIQVMVTYDGKKTTTLKNNNSKDTADVPEWFSKIIYPYEQALPKVKIYSFDNASQLTIQADTDDEIEEVWEDFKIQSLITIAFSVFIIFLMYLGLYFGLYPLNQLQSGFEKLEQGDFNTKVDEDVSQELSIINKKFNHMVTVLKNTSYDNSLLVKKLVNIQEEERKSISRELHDEMGPHLFGIRVNASKARSLLKENQYSEIDNQLTVIDNSVVNLQTHMRKLLKELRPLILDDLTIEEAIHSIVDAGEISSLNIDWKIDLSNLIIELDDTLTVTLYRIAQECVTNIVRHSQATKAKIVVASDYKDNTHSNLIIVVEDNGKGLNPDNSYGFGLIGMRERVVALGGVLELTKSEFGGVKLEVNIPIG